MHTIQKIKINLPFLYLFLSLILLVSCGTKVRHGEVQLCGADCTITTQSSSFFLVEQPSKDGQWLTLTATGITPLSVPLGAKPLFFDSHRDTLIASRVEKKDVSLFLHSKTGDDRISFPRESVILSVCQTKDNSVWVLYLDQEDFPLVKGVLSIFPLHNPEKGKSYLLSKSDGNRAKMRARAGLSIEKMPFKLICHDTPLIAMNEWVSDLTMIHIYSFNESTRSLDWKTGLSEISGNRKLTIKVDADGVLQLFDGNKLITLSSSSAFPSIARFDSAGEMVFSQNPDDTTMLFIPENQKNDKKIGRMLKE